MLWLGFGDYRISKSEKKKGKKDTLSYFLGIIILCIRPKKKTKKTHEQ